MRPNPINKSYFKPFLLWASIQIFIFLVVFDLFIFFGYRQLKQFLHSELGDNLELVAKLTVENIDPEWIEELYIEPEFYTKTKSEEFLVKIVEEQKMANVFILDTTGVTLYSHDWSLVPGELNSYLALDHTSFMVALSGITNSTKVYEFKNRFIKTGYAPVMDEWQNTIAVLGVEAGDEYFNILRIARKGVTIFASVSLLSVLILLGLMIVTLRVLKHTEKVVVQTATLSTMGEMASMMAHEIRNPLAIMKLSTEELEQNIDPEYRELTGYILEEINRLNGIVDGYLSFSKPQTLEFELTDPNQVIREIVQRIGPEFSKQNINIEQQLGEVSAIKLAVNAFKQAILNILLNSKDAIVDTGSININTSTRSIDSRNYVIISISDTGKGISQKELKRVFDLSYSNKPGGTGLGLYITKRIMDNHNAFIEIHSEAGEGTEVVLGFPESEEK